MLMFCGIFCFSIVVIGYFAWRWKEPAWNIPVAALLVALGVEFGIWLDSKSSILFLVFAALCIAGGFWCLKPQIRPPTTPR